jgi:hypothetical protein
MTVYLMTENGCVGDVFQAFFCGNFIFLIKYELVNAALRGLWL